MFFLTPSITVVGMIFFLKLSIDGKTMVGPWFYPRGGHSQTNVLPTRVQTPQKLTLNGVLRHIKWTLNGVLRPLRHIKFAPLNGVTPVKHNLNGVIRGVTYPKWRTLLWYTVQYPKWHFEYMLLTLQWNLVIKSSDQ